MSTAQTVIHDAVIEILAHRGACTMDEVVTSLPIYEWSEIFSAVDDMSRDGRLVIRRPSGSIYELSLSASCQGHGIEHTRPLAVRFCMGCGYLCDEIRSQDGREHWTEARQYVKQYGLTWEDLARADVMCPACSRLQACGTRRVSSRTAVQAAR